MNELMDVLGMQCLIKPQFKLSQYKAWTGICGIVTSHIAFHYWTIEEYVQLDIYSCKSFDVSAAKKFLRHFWQTEEEKCLFINRAANEHFNVAFI